jgi:hypothetical protein
MFALLMAGWLSLPIAPLNPVQQDTLDFLSLHVTGGINIANGTVKSGPEVTAKMEALAVHPLVIRAAVDYRYGQVESHTFPDGHLSMGILSLELLYYRGTNRLTGYLGLGVLYSIGDYSLTTSAADSLRLNDSVSGTGIRNTLGYRFTLGLRIRGNISLELGVTELKPKLLFYRQVSPTLVEEDADKFRNSSFRISIGYVIPLLK